MTIMIEIEKLLKDESFPFYVAMLIPKIPLHDIDKLKIRAKIKKIELVLKRRDEESYYFKARFIKRGTAGILFTPSEKAWFLIGRASTKDTFIKILRHLYPLIAFPIIRVNNFIQIIEEIAKYYDLEIIQYLLRKKVLKETTKKWARMKYEEGIMKIKKAIMEEHTVLDSVRLLIKSRYSPAYMELSLDRIGLLSIYNGIPGIHIDLEGLIIRPHIEAVYKDRELFGQLRRYIDEKTLEPRAKIAIIEFPNRIGMKEFEKFLNALIKTHYISVYQKGNPYLHILAIDKSNGSAYEILITSRNARIIPGPKTEVDSLYLILEALYNINSFSSVRFTS